ncbi:MAG: 50S ribosomal protein L16 [Elusimicrobiota bacterium]|nr:50S ribosomal protein L16 [Elusimicrobiota bacterium]
MLAPKKVKHRKVQKGRIRGVATRAVEVSFGEWGLKSLGPKQISARQIEACRIGLVRSVRKSGKIWIRLFPDKPITKKPAETRMGKGKGAVEGWVAIVKPGQVMFEIEGIPEEEVKKVFKLVTHKLGLKTRIVERH